MNPELNRAADQLRETLVVGSGVKDVFNSNERSIKVLNIKWGITSVISFGICTKSKKNIYKPLPFEKICTFVESNEQLHTKRERRYKDAPIRDLD
jgi:hypothetical protein